jgi:hypothetical protein
LRPPSSRAGDWLAVTITVLAAAACERANLTGTGEPEALPPSQTLGAVVVEVQRADPRPGSTIALEAARRPAAP